MNNAIIEVNNLVKQFKNSLAVNNLSFKINKGTIIGLLGPNGCGKTTTMGMMLGLIKPTSGAVFINGQDIENEKNRTNILEKMNFISPYIELPKKLTVGSSKRSISGSLINALARETLFFCPEESSPVFLFLKSNKFNCFIKSEILSCKLFTPYILP